MKTRNYKKATENIFNRIGMAVTRQIPTLDYIMNVAEMSPTDKIFFDAYKKYGNRNHTWTDFKQMFNGDVATMQKTVRHWRTWDEIDALSVQKHTLISDVRKLLEKYDIPSIDENRPEYRPKK